MTATVELLPSDVLDGTVESGRDSARYEYLLFEMWGRQRVMRMPAPGAPTTRRLDRVAIV